MQHGRTKLWVSASTLQHLAGQTPRHERTLLKASACAEDVASTAASAAAAAARCLTSAIDTQKRRRRPIPTATVGHVNCHGIWRW